MSNEDSRSIEKGDANAGRSTAGPDRDAERDATPALYAAISHPHRRFVLSRLLNADQPLSVEDLADYVATRDRSFPSSVSREGEQYQRMAVGLRNTHLPALADLGFVDYDGRLAAANESTERAEKYIHMAAQDEHVRLAGRE